METGEYRGKQCPCKRSRCVRHGDCVACRLYHEKSKKHPPYCEKSRKEGNRKE